MQKVLGAFQAGKHEDSEVRIVCHVPEKEGRLVLTQAWLMRKRLVESVVKAWILNFILNTIRNY